ncbi:olfactory receptor 52D1-like [Rhinoderma darwinii]|uniref:olfactory receptor 52D1-like n=1 Tax=Rhinoderma darwinii TaxID=43563 RepID=UPI003F667E78
MENTTISPLMLTLNFGELTVEKYFYCFIVIIGYALIVVCNGAVIVTVWQHQSLQEPMYIFISVLCMNGLYGSSAFFPSLLINLLQKNPSISYRACLTQVFCIHTYGSFEMTILASMSYDRYVSICNPLRYNTIMTSSTIGKILFRAWLYPVTLIGVLVILTARLPLCRSHILKIYCDNWSVVSLSCTDTIVLNIFGLFGVISLFGLMSLMIFYSYLKIIRVCMKSPKNIKEKALQTCTPHLITITNFLVDILFEILLYRLAPTKLPYELRVIMSLQILVVPPMLNPFIYGLKMKAIKSRLNFFR